MYVWTNVADYCRLRIGDYHWRDYWRLLLERILEIAVENTGDYCREYWRLL